MDTRRVADGIASAFLDPVDTSYKHRTMPRNGRARIFRARTRRMYPIPEARIAKVRGVHYGRAKQWKDNTPAEERGNIVYHEIRVSDSFDDPPRGQRNETGR
ncbi:hypothetical protein HN011_002483 [Eciton burchellii]|nr:hypothetical protein HN011_002483 [Eciton burchellii]